MISIGRDLDGMNLVIGRAMHMGDMLPAKVKPDHSVAYVSHGGDEHMKHDFEVQLGCGKRGTRFSSVISHVNTGSEIPGRNSAFPFQLREMRFQLRAAVNRKPSIARQLFLFSYPLRPRNFNQSVIIT